MVGTSLPHMSATFEWAEMVIYCVWFFILQIVSAAVTTVLWDINSNACL